MSFFRTWCPEFKFLSILKEEMLSGPKNLLLLKNKRSLFKYKTQKTHATRLPTLNFRAREGTGAKQNEMTQSSKQSIFSRKSPIPGTRQL
jgi:hypothetical protein